jgi:hypothetical protein
MYDREGSLEEGDSTDSARGGDTEVVMGKDNTKHQCENTAQGRLYITDAQGLVCTRAQYDFKRPGCCRKGQVYNQTTHDCE